MKSQRDGAGVLSWTSTEMPEPWWQIELRGCLSKRVCPVLRQENLFSTVCKRVLNPHCPGQAGWAKCHPPTPSSPPSLSSCGIYHLRHHSEFTLNQLPSPWFIKTKEVSWTTPPTHNTHTHTHLHSSTGAGTHKGKGRPWTAHRRGRLMFQQVISIWCDQLLRWRSCPIVRKRRGLVREEIWEARDESLVQGVSKCGPEAAGFSSPGGLREMRILNQKPWGGA